MDNPVFEWVPDPHGRSVRLLVNGKIFGLAHELTSGCVTFSLNRSGHFNLSPLFPNLGEAKEQVEQDASDFGAAALREQAKRRARETRQLRRQLPDGASKCTS